MTHRQNDCQTTCEVEWIKEKTVSVADFAFIEDSTAEDRQETCETEGKMCSK